MAELRGQKLPATRIRTKFRPSIRKRPDLVSYVQVPRCEEDFATFVEPNDVLRAKRSDRNELTLAIPDAEKWDSGDSREYRDEMRRLRKRLKKRQPEDLDSLSSHASSASRDSYVPTWSRHRNSRKSCRRKRSCQRSDSGVDELEFDSFVRPSGPESTSQSALSSPTPLGHSPLALLKTVKASFALLLSHCKTKDAMRRRDNVMHKLQVRLRKSPTQETLTIAQLLKERSHFQSCDQIPHTYISFCNLSLVN